MHAFIEGYVGLLTSWWWLALAGVTFVSIFVILLKQDEELSTSRAILLVFVGLVSLVPIIRHALPANLFMDFDWRWMIVAQGSFGTFAITYAIATVIFAPIFAFVMVCKYAALVRSERVIK